MSVLADLVALARERAKTLPDCEPPRHPSGPRLEDVLEGRQRLKVIAEYKLASPSLGPIAERNVVEQVRRYVQAGASAVSVLTEPTRFRGSLEHLELAAGAVDVPVLMKDFVVDPAQVRMAACLGARAVLLIARCLSATEIHELYSACTHYGLGALVECHDLEDVERALELEGAVIGVNNRDLHSLSVDRRVARRLLEDIPASRITVAESGYERPEQAKELRGLANAVLVGSALMRERDPAGYIREVLA